MYIVMRIKTHLENVLLDTDYNLLMSPSSFCKWKEKGEREREREREREIPQI